MAESRRQIQFSASGHENHFWTAINDLTLQRRQEQILQRLLAATDEATDHVMPTDGQYSRNEVLKKIEDVMVTVVQSLDAGEPPLFTYANRNTWENVRHQPGIGLEMVDDTSTTAVRFDNLPSVNKFAIMTKVLAKIYELVQTGKWCTKRDLYYQDVACYGTQGYLDNIIENIACMLQVPRWNLNVLAASKGLVVGDLRYTDAGGSYHDCAIGGRPVPTHVHGITNISSAAKMILVVEKDATYQKLQDEAACEKLSPCIIITGKGFPDVNTRLMVRLLWKTLNIPVLALVDADPYGIEILCVYKYGSRALSFEASHLTVPTIQWIGVLPTDMTRIGIRENDLLTMTPNDMDKARSLLLRPYMDSEPAWKLQIEHLIKGRKKVEIQSLQNISRSFLVDVYLRSKIFLGGWI